MLADRDILKIRSRFPIFSRKIYLNSCSQGALSDSVEAALQEYVKSWHEAGSPWDIWVQKYEAVRAQFAEFIGAQASEVAVVPSASAGINAVASAIRFLDRKRVVLGQFEFPTMGHVWLAQQPRGAEIHFVRANDEEIPTAGYEAAIDQQTAVVPLTHVCFKNGFRSHVSEVVQLARASGAYVFVDDYQDCGTRPINVKSMNVDFYVAGTLKYLLAAPGLAFLYVRKELIPALDPTISGWFAQSNPFAFDVEHLDLAPTARKFEAGTPPIPNLYAASAGMNLLKEIGLENVAAQIKRLAQALIAGAHDLGIHVKTPESSVGPLVVLQCRDVDAVIAKLAAQNIVVSGRHDGLRVSFHVHNTLDDVQQVLSAVKSCLNLMVLEHQPA